MEKLSYSIKEEYSVELNKINNRLSQLKSGRVYELSNARMDGSLFTNIEKLENEIDELLCKIQIGKRGISQDMKEAIGKLDS